MTNITFIQILILIETNSNHHIAFVPTLTFLWQEKKLFLIFFFKKYSSNLFGSPDEALKPVHLQTTVEEIFILQILNFNLYTKLIKIIIDE